MYKNFFFIGFLCSVLLLDSPLTGSSSIAIKYLAIHPIQQQTMNFTKGDYSQPEMRNYLKEINRHEQADISYIVKTIAKSSPINLLKYRPSLEKAGSRVAHIHPLKFLECVFTNDDLIAGVHSIRKSSLVWKSFFGGIKESMSEEYAQGNIKTEYVQDFSNNLKVDFSFCYALIQKRKWQDFVDYLIESVPRNAEAGRYDF